MEGALYSVEDGRLFLDPAGSDPLIEKNGLYLDASTAKFVSIGMSSNCPDNVGTVYFTTSESPSYGEDKKFQFTVTTPGWYDYSVSMADNSLWEGTVTGIRIDPANNGITGTNEDTVGFEYITYFRQVTNFFRNIFTDSVFIEKHIIPDTKHYFKNGSLLIYLVRFVPYVNRF
ncbi:hypothetical protein DU52_12945 [Methanosarcina mazei]|uniref:Uncharacterized protein n=2 Tax=Methanosarcina mazei TaxID=2209 RepID=A0A0F8EPH1_METMZ|nr:hypothetical protein [Methanosarcina mazei]AKB72576.1 hypothetical protein MSMAC_2686 [Methanosarcina mazei C16]KKG32034.1 hypothetical protein DU52_12945 [Methanosarcina mazei]